MAHNTEQSLVVCVIVRNRMSGLWIVSSVIISVLDGLRLPGFRVLCKSKF